MMNMTGFRGVLTGFILVVFFQCGKCQQAGINVCVEEKVPCDNLECIDRRFWCDLELDCSDGSDEEYCNTYEWSTDPHKDNNCTEKHFVCDDGGCVPLVVVCDNFNDCQDNSDEKHCYGESDKRNLYYETPSPVEDIITWELPSREIRDDNKMVSFSSYDAAVYETPSTIRSTVSTSPELTHHTPKTATGNYVRITEGSLETPHQDYALNYHGQSQNYELNYRNQQNPNSYHQNKDYDVEPSRLFPTRGLQTAFPLKPSPATFRDEYDSSRVIRHSHAQRQQPAILEPRSVLYPPNPRQLDYNLNKNRNLALPPFYFANNYTEQIGYGYERNVKKGKQWLIDQRDSSYGWDQDTPRALVALSLITNSFTSNVEDNDLMKKGLQAHLGIKLLRKKTEPLTVTGLAMYINALHATCQNPRAFLGLDLVDDLYRKRNVLFPFQSTVNPFIYLTLCLSNSYLSKQDIQKLESLLVSRFPDDIAKDRHILATTTLACILQQEEGDYEFRSQKDRIREKVNDAVHILLPQQNADGSFGSIYSTAIAAQALMSSNTTYWDPRPTLDFLAQKQHDDGSFGDMLSTYYSLPALSGRSLVHLRNTQCDPLATADESLSPQEILNLPGPKKSVFYSLKVGYPETFSFSMQLTVPVNTDLFDSMRVAAYLDPRFRFRHKNFNNQLEIYAISNVPNDPERGLRWNLFVLEPSDATIDLSRRYTGDIKTLIPRNSQEILYWYLSTV